MVDKKIVLVDDLDSSVGVVDKLYSIRSNQPTDSVGKVGITDLVKHLPRDIIVNTGVVTVDGDGRATVSDVSKITGVRASLVDINYETATDFFNNYWMTNNLPPVPTNGARLFFKLKSDYLRRFGKITVSFRSYVDVDAYWCAVDFMNNTISKYTHPTDGFSINATSASVDVVLSGTYSMPQYTDPNTYDTIYSVLCIDVPDTENITGISAADTAAMLTRESQVPGMEGVEAVIDIEHAPTRWVAGVIDKNYDYDLLSSAGRSSTFKIIISQGNVL